MNKPDRRKYDNEQDFAFDMCLYAEYLEETLDLACEELSKYEKVVSDEFGGGFYTKGKWKRWLLNEITERYLNDRPRTIKKIQ